MCTLLLILLLLGIGVLWIEARHRLRPSSPLQLRAHDWQVQHTSKSLVLEGWLTITNPHQRMEVMRSDFGLNVDGTQVVVPEQCWFQNHSASP